MDPHAVFDNFRTTVFEHYFDMNGRVGRAQFWYFVLAYVAFAIVAGLLSAITFLPVAGLYGLAMLLPSAGMGARRLQDIGRDGKLVWIFIFAAFVVQLTMVITAFGALAMGWFGFLVFGPSLLLLFLLKIALLVAMVVLIYFWCQPGDPGANAYGPPPPVFDPSRRVFPSP
ncbi:MAG TPA: DUF805 domain-containing protein [Rhizomicrobium sp.]|nr:DUF805 domain-containing protein [Rhizomicrobium sp.]